jgi:hypothetical protein
MIFNTRIRPCTSINGKLGPGVWGLGMGSEPPPPGISAAKMYTVTRNDFGYLLPSSFYDWNI